MHAGMIGMCRLSKGLFTKWTCGVSSTSGGQSASSPSAAGCDKLYEGKGNNVDWIATPASGGDGMAADAARLFPQQQE